MATTAVEVLSDAGRVAAALSPLRRTLLSNLAEPDSAAGLARRLNLPRQKVNYHLRELERARLVEFVDQRQRRGLKERRLRTTARAYVIDPALLGAGGSEPEGFRDRFSSAYLLASAARVIGDVAVLRERAEAVDQRLATLTVDTEIAVGSLHDLGAFAEELQSAIAELAVRYQRPGGRRYRLLAMSHPAITKTDREAAAEAAAHSEEKQREPES
jgi:DNA-binding transcriptional ArsR family regulator